MVMNEQETRYFLIELILREKGYDEITKLRCETPALLNLQGLKQDARKVADELITLLCVQVGDMPKPLPVVAVLEAKKEDEDPLKGMQQAKKYPECERFEVKYVFASLN